LWGLQQRQETETSKHPADSRHTSPTPKQTPHRADKNAVQGERVSGYEKFTGCKLVKYRNNDGDSFQVRLPDGRKEELRLYFVDTPESQRKHYHNGETNLKRIGYQARYFGVSPDRAVEIGHTAKKRVLAKLGADPCTVFTKWEPVFDSGRYFAFVQLPDGQWLHEWLVREGLARIYTKGETMPDGTAASRRKKFLRSLEAKAKKARRGGWK
jgi:endonuclease YncB( thermonuclease family)